MDCRADYALDEGAMRSGRTLTSAELEDYFRRRQAAFDIANPGAKEARAHTASLWMGAALALAETAEMAGRR